MFCNPEPTRTKIALTSNQNAFGYFEKKTTTSSPLNFRSDSALFALIAFNNSACLSLASVSDVLSFVSTICANSLMAIPVFDVVPFKTVSIVFCRSEPIVVN